MNALQDPIQPHHNATCLGSKRQIQKRIRPGFSLNNGRQSRRTTIHADHTTQPRLHLASDAPFFLAMPPIFVYSEINQEIFP
jgi:hypothetical protein